MGIYYFVAALVFIAFIIWRATWIAEQEKARKFESQRLVDAHRLNMIDQRELHQMHREERERLAQLNREGAH